MVGIRQFIRPDIAASVIAHLSILTLVLFYAEAHPFNNVPSEPVNVDIVTPDEIEKKPEPAPSPQLPADLRSLPKAAEQAAEQKASSSAAPPPASAQAASAQPQQAARANRKEAAPAPQQPSAPTAPPQPAASQASASASSLSPAYAQPQPDLTVKYHVMLGLPEAMPASVLTADKGDKSGDGGDAASKADVGTDMVTALRARIRECSKLPPSLSPSDDIFIKMRVVMTRDGRLAAEPVAKEGSASLKAIDLKESAVAALARCQPYTMLPAEKYDEWKVIDLTFTPRDFNS
jgi:hypothetical protein